MLLISLVQTVVALLLALVAYAVAQTFGAPAVAAAAWYFANNFLGRVVEQKLVEAFDSKA